MGVHTFLSRDKLRRRRNSVRPACRTDAKESCGGVDYCHLISHTLLFPRSDFSPSSSFEPSDPCLFCQWRNTTADTVGCLPSHHFYLTKGTPMLMGSNVPRSRDKSQVILARQTNLSPFAGDQPGGGWVCGQRDTRGSLLGTSKKDFPLRSRQRRKL